jgi:hypothetical protein
MQLLPEPVLDLGDDRASGDPGAQNLLTTDHAALLGGNSMQARRNLASHAGEYAVLHRHFSSRDHIAAPAFKRAATENARRGQMGHRSFSARSAKSK